MAKIISDEIITASQFAEYYSGKFFFNCDTYKEVKRALFCEGIYISDGINLTEIPEVLSKAPKDSYFVIVQFSTEYDYTKYEYKLMRIQKRYIKRFLKAMEEDYEEQV